MVRILRALRWTLFFEGWVLLAAPAILERWSFLLDTLWGGGKGFVSSYFQQISIVSWCAGVLCLATFWGLGKQKRWVRWTGLTVSLFNLLLFPPLGLTGLVVTRRFVRYYLGEEGDQDSLTQETSVVRMVRIVTVAVMLGFGYRWLSDFADRHGIEGAGFGWQTIVIIVCGQVLVAFCHDLGHSLAAVALGFRFPVFRIGPWAVATSDKGEVNFQGELNRFFAHDSYLSGIPGDTGRLSFDLIVAAAAGPALSLFASCVLFLAMLGSPGTAFANEGRMLGVIALLFALDFSIHMLPFGFSDGRVLVDLLSKNRRGRNILQQMSAAMHSSASDSAGSAAVRKPSQPVTGNNFKGDPIARHREDLQLLVRRGVMGGLHLAQAHQNLGAVELMAGNMVSAREHLERSLELLSGFPDPQYSGCSWTWLEKLHRRRQAGMDSHNAYGRGVQSWQVVKESQRKTEDVIDAHVSLAALHLGQGELGSCIEDLEHAGAILDRESGMHLLRGRYHAVSAVCGFRLRWQAKARTEAFAAVRDFTHKKLDARSSGLGQLLIADMAADLWLAGQGALAAELLNDVIEWLRSTGSDGAMNHLRLIRAEILAKTGDRPGALDELDTIANPGAEGERKIAEILGWANYYAEKFDDAAQCFAVAASTLDERERARMRVAEARANIAAGHTDEAYKLARSACDVLMAEEHGEAGVALMLLALQMYSSCRADSSNHPFFEEGRRIVRAARFQPPPDKLLALQDLTNLYTAMALPLEAAELQEETHYILNQMSWQPHFVAVDPDAAADLPITGETA